MPVPRPFIYIVSLTCAVYHPNVIKSFKCGVSLPYFVRLHYTLNTL